MKKDDRGRQRTNRTNDEEVRNWTKEYISSPKYLERLSKFYDNPKKVQQTRLAAIDRVQVYHQPKKEWYDPNASAFYRPSTNNITDFDDALDKNGQYGETSLDSTRYTQAITAHEFSHVNNAGIGPGRNLSSKEADYIRSRNRTIQRRAGTSGEGPYFKQPELKWYERTPHAERPAENKSEIDAFRFWLKKNNIYDAGKEDFKYEHLEKAYENGAVPAARELFENFDDDKIIELMNNIAYKPGDKKTTAAMGGQIGAGKKDSIYNRFMQHQANGGRMVPLSSNSVEAQGPSHENGGIDLPSYNAEIEGKETIADDYVFSHRLGFAQLHKPIAKAKGRIEGKAPTQERINALNRLQGAEEKLKQRQELIKQILHG